MRIVADTHTHSLASGHAYSTIGENMKWAAKKKLQLVALTDHAPAMPHTTCRAYFANLHVLPETLYGVRLLRGIELNIMDYDGTVDMDEAILAKLDIVIASLHTPCLTPGSKRENTKALRGAMENPYVDIIGHPGDPRYPMDYEEIFRAAGETKTLLEINNASLVPGGFREGSRENITFLLKKSMEEGRAVVLGSDAHFYTGIGELGYVEELLRELQFPEELALNTDVKRFLAHLKPKAARQ